MKLDRNINPDGHGKYALIEMRMLSEKDVKKLIESKETGFHASLPSQAITLGEPDQFFVIKLKDRFAARALHAYACAIYDDCAKGIVPPDQRREMEEYADQVCGEALAAERTPCKLPS